MASVIVSAAFIASACADPLPLERVKPASGSQSVVGKPRAIRPDEKAFDDIAQRMPGFGGYFRSPTGELVMVSTRATEKTALLTEGANVVSQLQRALPGSRLTSARVVDGKFSFWQLAQIRDLLFEQALGRVPGMHGLDLDEQANRVSVGLTEAGREAARQEVIRLVRDAGLDTLAIAIVTYEPPRVQSMGALPAAPLPPPGWTLASYWSEVVGGIQWAAMPRYTGCSVGVVADWNGQRGFVSASHCSQYFFQLENTTAYQPDTNSSFGSMATEYADPAGANCWSWTWNGYLPCRDSDASFFRSSGAMPMHKGLIARPAYRTSNGADPAYTTVDQAKPYFIVTSAALSVPGGSLVDKVGVRTGWTSGIITNSCHDQVMEFESRSDKFILKCSYKAAIYSREGDSGGPFFMLDPSESEASLVGILSGGDGSTAYISRWTGIANDLGGGLSVTRGFALTTPSLSGSVSASGNPVVSWTNVPGATRYVVYREWFRRATGESGSSSEVWQNPTEDTAFQVTSFRGASIPGPHTPGYVSYRVVAYNLTDASQSSTVQYFELAP
ncbi:MAG: chymotrypsin family serine protease [Gemmatimonadaceae bacterium]